jgi:hypothetical protein
MIQSIWASKSDGAEVAKEWSDGNKLLSDPDDHRWLIALIHTASDLTAAGHWLNVLCWWQVQTPGALAHVLAWKPPSEDFKERFGGSKDPSWIDRMAVLLEHDRISERAVCRWFALLRFASDDTAAAATTMAHEWWKRLGSDLLKHLQLDPPSLQHPREVYHAWDMVATLARYVEEDDKKDMANRWMTPAFVQLLRWNTSDAHHLLQRVLEFMSRLSTYVGSVLKDEYVSVQADAKTKTFQIHGGSILAAYSAYHPQSVVQSLATSILSREYTMLDVVTAREAEQLRLHHWPEQPHRCSVCQTECTTRCSRCHASFFCSRACLKQGWSFHKSHGGCCGRG